MLLKEKIEKYQIKKAQNFKTEWTALAGELRDIFQRNCFWIPRLYEMWKIRQALKVTQEKSPGNFAYFLGVLRKI